MRLRDYIYLGSFAIFLAMVLGAQTTNAALIFEHPNPQAGANFRPPDMVCEAQRKSSIFRT